jgi:hypothetical protein
VQLIPYVSTAAFKAHPTFLDLLNLRSGDNNAADQDNELNNVLFMASSWADSYCQQPLSAHTMVDHGEIRPDRTGRLRWHTENNPIRAVTSYAYGGSIGQMTTVTSPVYRLEQEYRQVVIELGAGAFSWSGSLQLGFGPTTSRDLYFDLTYVAGYANTLLTVQANAGANSVTVADPTGIYPGDILRFWDPGSEEAVTVASGYVPGTAAVALAATTTKAHAVGAPLSGLPTDAYLAVINYGCAMLTRPVSRAESAFPGGRSSTTKRQDARGKGDTLVAEAQRLLKNSRRIR